MELPPEQVRSFNAEMADLMAWFNDHGYTADIRALRRLVPELMTFEQFLRR